MAASASQTAASVSVHQATRARTVLASVPPTLTESTAQHAAPAKTPWPARPRTVLASVRKVGNVVTALCPAHLEPGASVAMPVASVSIRQPAAPKLELVPAPLGGMGFIASFLARRDSLVKAVPGIVTANTPMAVTLFMDTASARLDGWVSVATSPAMRASGE